MAEPLAVDPARLIAAGSKLAELVFPTAPSPIAATGSDAVSAAINDTMPGIESLVSDGLPGVTAALKRTAGSISTAADTYAKADQSLGDALRQYGFDADGQTLEASGVTGLGGQSAALLGGGAGAAALLGAPAGAASLIGEAVQGQVAALSPQVAATVPQLVQLAPMAQQMSPMAQQVGQSVQQAASQGSQGGGAAQLASDTKPADEADDEDKDDDAGAPGDEAAAGPTTLVSAPVEGAAGGTPSGTSRATPI